MNIVQTINTLHDWLDKTRMADGIAPLFLRLYLAPVLMQAGWNKMQHFEDTVAWFGNSDWGLGLPLPALMASLAIAAEFIGSILLLMGLATRWVAIPLMATMIVAAVTTHMHNGWLAIADPSSWLANGTIFHNESVMESAEKLEMAKSILQEHGHYEWLTASGNFVILNNGVEFAMTYFVMLLVLFFTGGGRYTSLDYVIARKFRN